MGAAYHSEPPLCQLDRKGHELSPSFPLSDCHLNVHLLTTTVNALPPFLIPRIKCGRRGVKCLLNKKVGNKWAKFANTDDTSPLRELDVGGCEPAERGVK